MGVDTTLAVLYAQTGLGTQFAHAAAVTPQASAAVSRLIAIETAKQEKNVVEKASKSDRTGVSKDKRERNKDVAFGSRRRSRNSNTDDGDDTPLLSDTLTGNFLNLTV